VGSGEKVKQKIQRYTREITTDGRFLMSKVPMVFGQVSLEETKHIMTSTEMNLFTESCHMDRYLFIRYVAFIGFVVSYV
jgi:nitrate/TMAO reductase-like tetraheme cytochrome c subunit